MSTQDARDRRALVFLGVLMSHVVIVLLAIRAARQPASSQSYFFEPLVLMYVHHGARTVTNSVPSQRTAVSPRSTARTTRAGKNEPTPDNSITMPPEAPPQPTIDWEHEAELAAQNTVAGAEKEKNYRNLSALSPAQLSWIRENHMEPVPAGIQWTHPRFEFDSRTGLPILWINDHCVLVTLMVFCAVGRIEANGDLFKHMRDPHDP